MKILHVVHRIEDDVAMQIMLFPCEWTVNDNVYIYTRVYNAATSKEYGELGHNRRRVFYKALLNNLHMAMVFPMSPRIKLTEDSFETQVYYDAELMSASAKRVQKVYAYLDAHYLRDLKELNIQDIVNRLIVLYMAEKHWMEIRTLWALHHGDYIPLERLDWRLVPDIVDKLDRHAKDVRVNMFLCRLCGVQDMVLLIADFIR